MVALRKYFSWFTQKQVQRAPRVKLGALENCWLIYQDGNVLQKFAIHNISTSGLGLSISSPSPFALNQWYDVTLNLGDKKTKTRFRVIHLEENFLGGVFDQSHSYIGAEIHNYLKVQISAYSLLSVQNKYLNPEIRGKATWLTDGRNNEIFFTLENNEIIDFQISFLGNHLMGGRDKEILYGRVNHKDDLEPWIEWESLSASHWKEALPLMAKQYLQQVATIPDDSKNLLMSAIDTSVAYKQKTDP